MGDLQLLRMILQEILMHYVVHAGIDCDLTSTIAVFMGVSLDLGSHTLSPKLASL